MQGQSAHTPSAVRQRIAVVYADAILSTHGGLTPAALGNVRLCTVNVVIFQPTDAVHQERLA
jgi:hypothetical protein